MDLHKKRNEKRGISVVVGYAVLIAMTISLSVLVFQWLRYYVSDTGEVETGCPEGTNVVIQEAKCIWGPSANLSVSLKNKGRHTVDGFVIRVNNRTNSEQGFYTSGDVDKLLKPGESHLQENLLSYFENGLNNINLVEVQPFKSINGKNIYCDFVDSMRIECDSP